MRRTDPLVVALYRIAFVLFVVAAIFVLTCSTSSTP